VLRLVDLVVRADRRSLADQVAAFDQHIGCAEGDIRAAHRVDGEETDVRAFRGHGIDRLAGGVDDHEFEFRAKEPRLMATRRVPVGVKAARTEEVGGMEAESD
jgi:hypothetical protein